MIEKFLENPNKRVIQKFIDEVFVNSEMGEFDPVYILMQDKFGNFVIKNV